MQGFSASLMASLYPGAPFARTFMAVELLNALLEIFGDVLVPERVGLHFFFCRASSLRGALAWRHAGAGAGGWAGVLAIVRK